MSANASIRWMHHTFNPWHGCEEASPAGDWGTEDPRLFANDDDMAEPFEWNAQAARRGVRRRVFCMSTGDLFELHPVSMYASTQSNYRLQVFDIIDETPWLDWMLLTEQPKNIARMLPSRWRSNMPQNVWLGVSIENQEQADNRLPTLLDTVREKLYGTAVVFASCQPLLSAIDLTAAASGREFSHSLDLVLAAKSRSSNYIAPTRAGSGRCATSASTSISRSSSNK